MRLKAQLSNERRARMAAERLLEQKQVELREANRKLSLHALSLSDEIVEQRAVNADVRSELATANDIAQVAERRLWDSIETIQDGFAVFNTSNVLIAANEAYLKPFEGLTEVAPGISFQRLLLLAAEEGIVDTDGMTRRDWIDQMQWRWGQSRIDPMVIRLWNGMSIKLIDRRGRDGDMVSLALNITDTIRYEAKLKDARYRAEAANRAKSAFLANMSHEIRTPMNGVVSMAEILSDSELDEEQQLYVDTIRSSGEALLVLINDVLDYSKIEAEKLTIRPAPFDLEQTILDISTMLQTNARQKDLDLLVDYDMFLPREFVGDGGRIRQVLVNLVGNAIKFTKEGRVVVRAIGMPDAQDAGTQKLHITVEDTGIGIPREKLDDVFEDFNQVENERNRRHDGTGLGLAITRQLVKLMGGDVWVDSEIDVGSSFGFSLTLPVVDGQSELHAPLPAWLNRVVVADTQIEQRQILGKQLATRGLQVVKAATLDDLLDLGLGPKDVLILSSNLIVNQGLKRLEQFFDTGVSVLLSGAPLSELKDIGPVAGQLPRPVTRADLFAALSPTSLPPPQVTFFHAPTPAKPAPPPQEIVVTEPVVEFSRRRPAAPAPAPAPTPVEEGSSDLAFVEEPPEADSAPVLEPPQDIKRLMRVLAVDDNKTNRFVFGKLVKSLQIDLSFAENGVEAVQAFTAFNPDLIFMDISMPEMDGKDATKAIRKIEAEQDRARTPIVALTAHALDGDDQEILSAGLDHYLTKPFQKAAIFERIAQEQPEECQPVQA